MRHALSLDSAANLTWTLRCLESAPGAPSAVVEVLAYRGLKGTRSWGGSAPFRTDAGWLHFAHGVRGTAMRMVYILHAGMVALEESWRVRHMHGGHCKWSRIGPQAVDVSNEVFSNGGLARPCRQVDTYRARSRTSRHVATNDGCSPGRLCGRHAFSREAFRRKPCRADRVHRFECVTRLRCGVASVPAIRRPRVQRDRIPARPWAVVGAHGLAWSARKRMTPPLLGTATLFRSSRDPRRMPHAHDNCC